MAVKTRRPHFIFMLLFVVEVNFEVIPPGCSEGETAHGKLAIHDFVETLVGLVVFLLSLCLRLAVAQQNLFSLLLVSRVVYFYWRSCVWLPRS